MQLKHLKNPQNSIIQCQTGYPGSYPFLTLLIMVLNSNVLEDLCTYVLSLPASWLAEVKPISEIFTQIKEIVNGLSINIPDQRANHLIS